MRIESKVGEIALLTDTSSTFSQEKKTGSSVVWQSTRDKGNADQTVEHTEITATGAIQVIAAQGIRVKYRDTGNVGDSITQLAKQPGLAWMEQLRSDPKVNWQAVAEAHEKWDYKSEGLTGAGAALLSLAVAVATYGVGSGLESFVTKALTESLGAAWATGASMAGSAAQAGFASLCSQAAVGLVNNKGDVLATLQSLASDQGMRALASAMLTASLITGANAGLAKIDGLKDAVKAGDWAGKAAQDTLVTGTVQAGVGTALYGGDLGQNLLDGLRGAAVSSLGAKAANEIGEAAANGNLDYVAHKIAHAALGGAMAAANGQDAASGALGGVVGEVAGELVQTWLRGKLSDPNGSQVTKAEEDALIALGVNLAKLAGGMAAALVGMDVNTAAMTGGNAAQNNAILHWINDDKNKPNPKPEDLVQKGRDFANRVKDDLPDEDTYIINSGWRPGDKSPHGEGRGIDINIIDGVSMSDFGSLSNAALVAKYGQEKVQQVRQAADALVKLAMDTKGVNQIIGPTGGWDFKPDAKGRYRWFQMDPSSTKPRTAKSSTSDADLIRTHKNHFHINLSR